MNTLTLAVFIAAPLVTAGAWEEDFANQPNPVRPKLEVRYTDGSRSAFEIEAEQYRLRGELRKPHRLVDAVTGREWLSLQAETADGRTFDSRDSETKSRINLYRRGPYFCEVHWLDVLLTDGEGTSAPLKGDLALYCYPDKILASITWHAVGDFPACIVRAQGIVKRSFQAETFKNGSKQTFAFPIYGEMETVPASAFESLECVAPMKYDRVRGCYTIGSLSTGGFQGHFYSHPNRYETVRFRIENGPQPCSIYVCHENTGGDKGSVEGGVLLDEAGHPLPVVVQISKNFAGEKEERFYNPKDTPFSETYFPLYLQPNETRTLTSLHLYQNWGRHMVKQFSSLGAWMDYFHSSTGVTETTCYVPFKFGGLGGISIADLRAMSQPAFWGGQPQHDNVAGHVFLSYKAGDHWRYLVYQGTTYRSTGPNWMDIVFDFISSDGCVKATARSIELPQADELRNFINVRYEVLKPLEITNAKENFRLLTISSHVQRLRYKRFSASGAQDKDLDFSSDHFCISGQPLPERNAYAAVYGERKGSNSFIIRNWSAKLADAQVGPAVSVWCAKKGDTQMHLVPDADTLHLKPGDVISVDAFWMPYGDDSSADAPRREVSAYGANGPRIVSVTTGEKECDFPPTVRAKDNTAEFVLQGGRDLVSVLVVGLSDYRWPRIYRKESTGWKPVSHARVGDLDGVQTFCCDDGTFGAVFLVHSDNTPQQLRVKAGEEPEKTPRIVLKPLVNPKDGVQHCVFVQAPWMDRPLLFRYPETIITDKIDFIDHHREDMPPRVPSSQYADVWNVDADGSLWFEWKFDNQLAGGRLSPNEDDVDLEFWFHNLRKSPVDVSLQFCPPMANTIFEDRTLKRTWIHTNGKWKAMADTDRGAGKPELCHYPVDGAGPIGAGGIWGASKEVADVGVAAVTSEDGKYVFAIAWQNPRAVMSNAFIPCMHADPKTKECPPGKRIHLRGKLYLIEGTLDDLLPRVRRELGPLSGR